MAVRRWGAFGLAVVAPVVLVVGLALAMVSGRGAAPAVGSPAGSVASLFSGGSAFAPLSGVLGQRGAAVSTARRAVGERYGQLPLVFEANRGQSDPRVRFMARGAGYGLFLTSREAVLSLRGSGRNGRAGVLRMGLVGARRAPVVGEGALGGRVNYIVGSDRSRWRTGVPTFSRVSYANVWRGVGLTFYGRQRELEYDFRVAPGASPGAIRLNFGGARPALDARGDLLLRVRGGVVRQSRPVAYQVVGGRRVGVASRYALLGAGRVGVRVGSYDRRRPLVIDPVLSYSTYLGGNGFDFGDAVAVDAAGSAYLTGHAQSTNFPTANAVQGTYGGDGDAFVAKLNPAGSALVYSTYLGGGLDDAGGGIAVDAAGSAYLTGQTDSSNFPTANALQGTSGGGDDAFVAKLNRAGSALVYSTYLGGSGFDYADGVAVDSAGSAYLTGRTHSTNFPTANALQGTNGGGSQDAFVAKLNPGGSALVYSTYLGGSRFEDGLGVAVDSAGSAYLAGTTSSTNFPTANALQSTSGGTTDAFVAKLNPGGSALVYATYLGGSSFDDGVGVAVDSAGSAYLTGATSSTNFPTANALQSTSGGGSSDAFVAKLNAGGSALVYSTSLGGSGGESGLGVAVDAAGSAYLTGVTSSTDFPIANALQGTSGGGGVDAFVAKLTPGGLGLVYASYLGGSGSERGTGVAVDSAGSAYLIGRTASTNFPTANALQDTNGGGSQDAYVAKLSARPTSMSMSCSPGSPTVSTSTTCTATVTDTGPGSPTTPTGTVSFSSDSPGSLSPGASCTLIAGALGQASCSVTHAPSAAGTHRISASYAGDADHASSSAAATVAVSARPTPNAGGNILGTGGSILGTGGLGGRAGLCGGGGGGGGGIAAGGGGAGGGGCFFIPFAQRLRLGRILVIVGVGGGGATVRAQAFANLPARRSARATRVQLIGSTVWRRVRSGRYELSIRFTAKARRQLRRMRSARITLRLRLTPPHGRALAVTRTLTVRR